MKLSITVVLACVLGTSACKRHDTVLDRLKNASLLSDGISIEFAHAFPDTLKPFKKPPRLGRTGELTETQEPRFVLFNFPTQDISKVQSWLTPMVARYGIQSITVSYFQHVTTPDSDDIQTINGMNRITVFRDGRVESKTGLQVEQAWGESTIDGHQIMKSEQTMDGNRE